MAQSESVDPPAPDDGPASVQEEAQLREQYLASLGEERDERERLRHERDFWHHLFAQVVWAHPERAFTIATDGAITNWNRAMAERGDSEIEEALGQNADELRQTEGEDETPAETLVRTNESIREEGTVKFPTTTTSSRSMASRCGRPTVSPSAPTRYRWT